MDATRMESAEANNDVPAVDAAVPPTSGRSKAWLWLIAAFVILVAGGIAVTLAVANGTGDEAAGDATVNTATVLRTDLIVTEELAGTLGYGSADPITFRSSADGVTTIDGLAAGTVTSVVGPGMVVAAGDVLYEINAEPVVALYGDIPAYRTFNSRMSDGADVQQLEQVLVDLGFDPDGDITIDEDFTSATRDAIELLQESVGAEETGALALGDVIFVPGAFYVSDVLIDVGTAARSGEAVIATSKPIEGTVTSIVAEGAIVRQGGELLTIDGETVVLLIGETPVFRAMAVGVSGDDVLQLEDALVELGHGDTAGFTADGVFDEATRLGVVTWQEAIGATPDGVVNVGDVIFLPNPIRVGETLVTAGDVVHDGTQIMTTSVSSTFVSVELSTDDQDLVAVGDAVVVVLPDGTREPAVVTEIGTVVQANQQGATFFEMTVTLDDPAAAPGLDEAPVDVEVVGDSAVEVLAAPVTALIALAEGGYAVEVVAEDGTTFLVAVDPGLFADGFVEMTSDDLAAGMVVVIP